MYIGLEKCNEINTFIYIINAGAAVTGWLNFFFFGWLNFLAGARAHSVVLTDHFWQGLREPYGMFPASKVPSQGILSSPARFFFKLIGLCGK